MQTPLPLSSSQIPKTHTCVDVDRFIEVVAKAAHLLESIKRIFPGSYVEYVGFREGNPQLRGGDKRSRG